MATDPERPPRASFDYGEARYRLRPRADHPKLNVGTMVYGIPIYDWPEVQKILDWCSENLSGPPVVVPRTGLFPSFGFDDEQDAMKFKLYWC